MRGGGFQRLCLGMLSNSIPLISIVTSSIQNVATTSNFLYFAIAWHDHCVHNHNSALYTLTGSREGSAISEEEDGGAYESVDDFLCRDSSGAIIIGPPPSYIPPRPDHDYTPVKMEGGDMQVGQDERQEEIWGNLPIKSPIARKRPSVGSGSPQQPPPLLPLFGTSPSTKPVAIPPEPVTPPPSPPTPRVAGKELEARGEQRPSLPPKRRKSSPYSEPDTSRWRGSPPKIPAPVQV